MLFRSRFFSATDSPPSQTRQTVRTTVATGLPSSSKDAIVKKLNVIQTILQILKNEGPAGFFHGLGPALILVSNPILQFTVLPTPFQRN